MSTPTKVLLIAGAAGVAYYYLTRPEKPLEPSKCSGSCKYYWNSKPLFNSVTLDLAKLSAAGVDVKQYPTPFVVQADFTSADCKCTFTPTAKQYAPFTVRMGG